MLGGLFLSGSNFLSARPDAEGPTRPAREKPNVIVFFLDDSGYGDFSFNGNPVIETPAIDRLARRGFSPSDYFLHGFFRFDDPVRRARGYVSGRERLPLMRRLNPFWGR